jgi:serine/threonine protein kinase
MTAGAPDAPPPLAGRYRLVHALGRGGMGVVWLARDELLGREVAVKEIPRPPASESPQAAALAGRRAFREARVAAQLRHPAIVTVHDVVLHDGRPWIVMELIRGRSLSQALEQEGPLSEQRTARIGLGMLGALAAAHGHGVLHRDVKPSNIMLEGERAVLTDFGIAQLQDGTALTTTGALVGSPEYIAPERILGQHAGPAADLWGLGVALYTAVAGHSPFQRPDARATLAAVLSTDPHPPPAAERLWPALDGLLRKDPTDRLTTDEAAALLEPVALSAAIRPLPTPPTPHVTVTASTGPTLAGNPSGQVTRTVNQSARTRTSAAPHAPTATDNTGPPTSGPRSPRPGRWRAFAAPLAALLVVGGSAQLAWRTHHAAAPPDRQPLARATPSRRPSPSTAPTATGSASPSASPSPPPPAPPGFMTVAERNGLTLVVPDTWMNTDNSFITMDFGSIGWANRYWSDAPPPSTPSEPAVGVAFGDGAVDPTGTALSLLSHQSDLDAAADFTYQRISLTALPTPPGMNSAAQLEYTDEVSHTITGTPYRRYLARLIVSPSHQGYELDFYIASAPGDQSRDWSNSQRTLSTIFNSVQITD